MLFSLLPRRITMREILCYYCNTTFCDISMVDCENGMQAHLHTSNGIYAMTMKFCKLNVKYLQWMQNLYSFWEHHLFRLRYIWLAWCPHSFICASKSPGIVNRSSFKENYTHFTCKIGVRKKNIFSIPAQWLDTTNDTS